jgi:nucleotidyltransferase/DNA polymerase involved in DNA repair
VRPSLNAILSTSCCHIAEFRAWAVSRAEPVNHPVIVMEGGRVVSATRRARRAGIANGMQASRAQTLLPEAIVRQRDPALEEAAWEAAIESLYGQTPFIEVVRPGLAFFRGSTDAGAVALARSLGASIGACLDTAPRRAVAHLAAVRSAPGHVLRIPEDGVERFFRRFEAKRLEAMDFAPEFVEHLEWLGIRTLHDALHLTAKQLSMQFGAEGARFYGLLHPDAGERPVGLWRPRPTVSAEHEVEPGEEASLEAAITHLAEETAAALSERFAGHTARRLTLELGLRSGASVTACRILNTPMIAEVSIRETAQRMFRELIDADENNSRTLSTITLTLGSLAPAATSQAMLFGQRPAARRVMRAIAQKYPGVLKQIERDPHALWEEERARVVSCEP